MNLNIMKKLILIITLLSCQLCLFNCQLSLHACTNFIVGKSASTDGSVICTYNADDYGMFQNLCHYPAGKHEKGEMREVYDWDTGEYHGKIPEAAETYNVIGNINEYQVTIGETTYGGREEMVDSTGIIDYGSLIYITLQRSRSAREAITVMTQLAETYGYNSEGETFTHLRCQRSMDIGDDGMRSRSQQIKGTHRVGRHAHSRQCHLRPCQPESHRTFQHERQEECTLLQECRQLRPYARLVQW